MWWNKLGDVSGLGLVWYGDGELIPVGYEDWYSDSIYNEDYRAWWQDSSRDDSHWDDWGEEDGQDADTLLFNQLIDRTHRGETESVLGTVDAGAGLTTRGAAQENPRKWPRGMTLLHQACFAGQPALVRGLLDRGADLHARDTGDKGCLDALMWACCWGESIGGGNIEVITLLLDRGADVNESDAQGRTALAIAAIMGQPQLCLLLISRAADLKVKDWRGRTPLGRYGECYGMDSKSKAIAQAPLLAAFAAGPLMRWRRRAAFLIVLAENDFQPLAARRAELAVLHPPLPPDAVIPRLPCETPAQRRALLRDKVLSHPGIVKHVAAFI